VLAAKHGCLVCHGILEKIVGPAYRDIAARGYSSDQVIELVHKPKPENWPGFMPMPPMPQVPAEEIRLIAEWINTLKTAE
jgi:cytochrome c551/c552